MEAYAGFKGAEQPRFFVWRGKRHAVVKVVASWHQEDEQHRRKFFFLVEAGDSRSYLLSHTAAADEWNLEEEPK